MTQVKFYGYNALGTDGAICDMKNLTSDRWPELAVRPKRREVMTLTEPRGLGAAEKLCWAEGTDFHYGETILAGVLQEGTDKQFVVIGDYITIWPDGLCYDRRMNSLEPLAVSIYADRAEFISLEREISSEANCLTLGIDGWTASGEDGVLRYRSEETGEIVTLRAGDAVRISGCTRHPENNKTVIIREFAGEGIVCLDNTFAMDSYLTYKVGEGGMVGGEYAIVESVLQDGWPYYVVLPDLAEGDTLEIDLQSLVYGEAPVMTAVIGGEEQSFTLTAGFSGEDRIEFSMEWRNCKESGIQLGRDVPYMGTVIENSNRLMGCFGDTIFVSKLGDPFNWYSYDGTASDSWTTETGSLGDFTGAIVYGSYPRFFKEELMFTLYGDYPGEYQLLRQVCMGVAAGSGKSLAVVNSRLFWLSRRGPCMYAGGTPSFLAEAFGPTRFVNGVAGGDGLKYWLSMQSEASGAWSLFVYDTDKNLWMREDEMQAKDFSLFEGELYCLGADGGVRVLGQPRGTSGTEESRVDWFAEFGDFTEGSPDKKIAGKLQLRMEMDEGAVLQVRMKFDSGDDWHTVAALTAEKKKSVILPIIPRRVDHYRLRLEGRGGMRISSMARQIAAGSER